tara:strand:- start:255 stop:380 length:126 start_codon:yes stop_codon:yes gene_type:complete
MSKIDIKKRIADLMSVIPHCQNRADAYEMQEEINGLEILLQ